MAQLQVSSVSATGPVLAGRRLVSAGGRRDLVSSPFPSIELPYLKERQTPQQDLVGWQQHCCNGMHVVPGTQSSLLSGHISEWNTLQLYYPLAFVFLPRLSDYLEFATNAGYKAVYQETKGKQASPSATSTHAAAC